MLAPNGSSGLAEPEPEPEPELSGSDNEEAQPELQPCEGEPPQKSVTPSTVAQPLPFGDLVELNDGRCSLMPGIGVATDVLEVHRYSGTVMSRIEETQPPSSGWEERLLQHATYYEQERNKWKSSRGQSPTTNAEALDHRFKACKFCLATWPRGGGPGELLYEPIIDGTPTSERGVREEWWREACNRAPFVPTRIFVEAFVKPITRGAHCALWFFIPERFRESPLGNGGVFISHAWDLAMWDIRPEQGSILWMDTIAIPQHDAKRATTRSSWRITLPSRERTYLPAKEFYETQALPIPDCMGETRATLVSTVQAIQNTLLILGGTDVALLPLTRSWCCYEIAHTPQNKLKVRVGWSSWDVGVQQQNRQLIDSLDLQQAETKDPTDKEMIDHSITSKWGGESCSFEEANRAIRARVLHGYFVTVCNAYQAACRVSDLDLLGQRPVHDIYIVRMFVDEENPADVATCRQFDGIISKPYDACARVPCGHTCEEIQEHVLTRPECPQVRVNVRYSIDVYIEEYVYEIAIFVGSSSIHSVQGE
eukprot:COSAG02_NODE_6906_length_3296_cov_2.229903_1_plen_538_part_00